MSQQDRRQGRKTLSGDEFRGIRKKLDLTTDAFAIELGYEGNQNGNRNTIRRFETNERPVPLPIAKLAWLLSEHGLPTRWPPALDAKIDEETT